MPTRFGKTGVPSLLVVHRMSVVPAQFAVGGGHTGSPATPCAGGAVMAIATTTADAPCASFICDLLDAPSSPGRMPRARGRFSEPARAFRRLVRVRGLNGASARRKLALKGRLWCSTASEL